VGVVAWCGGHASSGGGPGWWRNLRAGSRRSCDLLEVGDGTSGRRRCALGCFCHSVSASLVLMSEPTVLWRSGDPWRDLVADLAELHAVTVISRSGAARFLDLVGGRHNRLALEGGHVMWCDTHWRPLEPAPGPAGWALSITPCGLNLLGVLDWAAGTPLWAVLEGLWTAAPTIGGHADWTSTAIGTEIVASIAQGDQPTSGGGRPGGPCGALYCQHGRSSP
jgi:hypothetical protein